MSAKVRLAFERAFDANTSCVRKQPCFAVAVRRGWRWRSSQTGVFEARGVVFF